MPEQYTISQAADYMHGNNGVKKDQCKALEIYHLLAENGNVDAQIAIGEYYLHRALVARDEDVKMAKPWFTLAANHGSAEAMYKLGKLYWRDLDCENAFKYFLKSAQLGYVPALYKTAECYWQGIGVNKNSDECLRWLKMSSDHEVSNAYFALGNIFEYGDLNQIPNINIAKEYYIKAYDAGCDCLKQICRCENKILKSKELLSRKDVTEEDQYTIGLSYARGEGVEQDWTEAAKWFALASDAGHVEASARLAWCYFNGKGVQKDLIRAFSLYRYAAEQDLDTAQYCLGWCYAHGYGVPQDYKNAVVWFEKAAKKGNVNAIKNLAWCYTTGNGVNLDYSKAVSLYERIEDGFGFRTQLAAIKTNLAYLYKNGLGCEKRLEDAKYLYMEAARLGNATAQCN